jgi:hypothetical protein
MMAIHSKILVHWTGKDIETNPNEDEKSRLYVERLKDDLREGLYAKPTIEDSIRYLKIKDITRLCFTEIRLSQAKTHSDRYGKLGIGFSRDFIMNKGGRPVIYIPFEPPADNYFLEASIGNVYEKAINNREIKESSKLILAHVKRMSDGNKNDYYEEMEWRIVHHANDKNIINTSNDIHRLKFKMSDIEVIIFPDKKTKQLSLEDDYIKDCLSKHMPIIATLDDCLNF